MTLLKRNMEVGTARGEAPVTPRPRPCPAPAPHPTPHPTHPARPPAHPGIAVSCHLHPLLSPPNPPPRSFALALQAPVTIHGHSFPRGTTFLLNGYWPGLDPERVPDPDAFKPERWLPEAEVRRPDGTRVYSLHQSTYRPGDGSSVHPCTRGEHSMCTQSLCVYLVFVEGSSCQRCSLGRRAPQLMPCPSRTFWVDWWLGWSLSGLVCFRVGLLLALALWPCTHGTASRTMCDYFCNHPSSSSTLFPQPIKAPPICRPRRRAPGRPRRCSTTPCTAAPFRLGRAGALVRGWRHPRRTHCCWRW